MLPIRKIVIIGPESTGKSTLCEMLALHFHTRWVPEYAREYLLSHGKAYNYDDLLSIAKGQIALEDKIYEELCSQISGVYASPDKIPSAPLFIDTDLWVMKIWCEYVFGNCHQWIIDQISCRNYDFYLLCNTDLPWVRDELREYPDLETREKLFRMYKDILINQNRPWTEIKGESEQRIAMAIDSVTQFIKG
jgi:NadR type nicotinamide-nucleotide adenylyltransferase